MANRRGLVGIILLFIIIVGDLITGGLSSHVVAPELCKSPPAGNPNPCHIYKWSDFPADNLFTPRTGMFNNDTSYYFQYNTTGIVGFTMCTNIISGFGDGNMTLTLQFTPDGSTWQNVDLAGAGTAGSIFGIGTTPGAICSQQNGDFQNLINMAACLGPGGIGFIFPICQFRIGGSMPIMGSSVQHNSITISELNIQFYYAPSFSQITNTITCTASARSLTAFTNTCTLQIQRGSTSTITVAWKATNETSSGCGATFNCWRSGSATCSILATNLACTNSVTFSPAFTITTPIIIENWSPGTDGQFNIKPSSSILPILT